MTHEIWQAVGVALGALLIAAFGYLTATLQAQTRALQEHQALLAARLVPGPLRPSRRSDPAGGAAPVRPAPQWNQLADPLSDGTLPAGRFNECGEECAAMEISRQHGVPLSADALRFLLGGASRAPLTTAQDLVRCLALCNVPAAAEATSGEVVAGRLQEITAAGGTAICLGAWVSPGVQHWILVTRADAQGCGANDPWEGRRRVWSWTAFRDVYAGELVTSQRPPDPLS